NGVIFSKEGKPHISRVFDGESLSFIVYGTRGSGKDYTIEVHVKSMAEFEKLYCGDSSSKKPTQKIPLERISHKALMIHI
ncbi:kinesin-like protein KIN-10C, partial [Tanacetum coccineum]